MTFFLVVFGFDSGNRGTKLLIPFRYVSAALVPSLGVIYNCFFHFG